MFKGKKKKDSDFGFDIEIAPVDEEEYGTKKTSKTKKIMSYVVIPFMVCFLLAGVYVKFGGGKEEKVAKPKEVVAPTETVNVDAKKTTEDLEKDKAKKVQAFKELPEGYVIYSNGFLSLASLVKSDWVVLERTQDSMNDITPFMKKGTFDWKEAKFKKPIPILDLISPVAEKPPLIRTYIATSPTDASYVAKLFSVSAKPVGGEKTKKFKIDKKEVKAQEYQIKDFGLKVTAVRLDKKIEGVTVSTVLIGEKGKAFNNSIESWYKTATSFKHFIPEGKKK